MSCRVLKLARGAYYRWVQQPVGKAEALRNRRVAALQAAHGDDPEFGYRLLADGASMAGTPMADRTAWRLCHRAGIVSVTVKTRRKKSKKPGPAVDAMNNAAARRGLVTRCVVHTDRGSQFRSKKFQRALEVRGLVASMGRVGAAGDNAAME